MGYTSFDLVLPSFTGFHLGYTVLLAYTSFDLVLPSFTGFHLGYTRVYWVILALIWFYLVLLGFTWLVLNLSGLY